MLSDSPIQAVIAVSDLAKTRPFYEQTLGLTPSQDMSDEGVVYECGGGTSLLVYPTTYPRGEATTANFIVDDFDAAVTELRGKGVTFEEYDFPGLKTENGVMTMDTPMGTMKSAWLKDPDGNTIALTQYPKA